MVSDRLTVDASVKRPASAPGLGVRARKLSNGIPDDVEGVLSVLRRAGLARLHPLGAKALSRCARGPSADCILRTMLGTCGICWTQRPDEFTRLNLAQLDCRWPTPGQLLQRLWVNVLTHRK